ncbi:potassium channel family protein [Brevundimonas sp.]|jgi:voltage-gated potassium channel|uniref:potassium channel family protein n=1 Tax=Brevundimonas sp. TaxID=1871086 RepID=UPI0017D55BCD|nr:potassium channel family protein [Brevundimonas sp.]MBA4807076.1 two pore domain potassium channel family protein [Brevundimonas sp.]
MLLPRMKLALIFDRAFQAMADTHWRMLGGLILLHAVSSWLLLALAGETELHSPVTFIYWYATTAYTVGYGDLSPQDVAGRLITAIWIFPGAIAAFTTVVAKVLGAIGDIWRLRRAGKGDYSKMTDTIIMIGYHPTRTPKMISELCAELNTAQTLVLVTRHVVNDLDSRVRYVHSESLTSADALARAGAATASRILVYADSDADTLTATLAASAAAPKTAHVVCFFDDADSARLLAQHCPQVEIVLSSGPEMLARSARDPGSSQVISALTSQLDVSATLFSLTWQGAARSFGDLAQRLLHHRATLLAHQPQGAEAPHFNPPPETGVEPGDRLFYVSAVRLAQASLAGS